MYPTPRYTQYFNYASPYGAYSSAPQQAPAGINRGYPGMTGPDAYNGYYAPQYANPQQQSEDANQAGNGVYAKPPVKNKNLKKFLMQAGAVVAGMFATVGLGIGLIAFVAPEQLQILKNIGGKPAKALVAGIKALKNGKGSLFDKLDSAWEAGRDTFYAADPNNKSPLNRLIGFFKRLFNKDAYEAEEAALKEKREEAKRLAEEAKETTMGDFAFKIWDTMSPDKKAKVEGKISDCITQSGKELLQDPEVQKSLINLIKSSLPCGLGWFIRAPK